MLSLFAISLSLSVCVYVSRALPLSLSLSFPLDKHKPPLSLPSSPLCLSLFISFLALSREACMEIPSHTHNLSHPLSLIWVCMYNKDLSVSIQLSME